MSKAVSIRPKARLNENIAIQIIVRIRLYIRQIMPHPPWCTLNRYLPKIPQSSPQIMAVKQIHQIIGAMIIKTIVSTYLVTQCILDSKPRVSPLIAPHIIPPDYTLWIRWFYGSPHVQHHSWPQMSQFIWGQPPFFSIWQSHFGHLFTTTPELVQFSYFLEKLSSHETLPW
jgi:hypothetical protein